MGTKQVRLDEDVYARIQDEKREDETFSDAVDRLTSDWSLAQWAQKYETDSEESATHREMLDELDEIDKQEAKDIVERVE
ncbi:antitoxin VapB family protein [Halovenus sp. HT40]|uniref:antitoxin VapB family protein n=1 Tax=Halovenus sp. HT40 TaxID=3126691 RepID=UPI00300EA290